MLQERYVLAKKLERKLYDIGRYNDVFSDFRKDLKEKYNIPESMTFDIVSGTKRLEDQNELICYWFTSELWADIVPDFFTQKEIRLFDKQKFVVEDSVFPLELPMCQVAIDQWIGTITIQELMKLRRDGLIHYNADTQRALRVLVKGEEFIYEPHINKSAVKQIYNRVKENTFVPNTLTLNISPDDEQADYDLSNGVMVINKVTNFDIVDGYHRLKAFERMYDEDNSFDMRVELRIISFSVDKAKLFIHQEDQKTKMKRVDSLSYDPQNECNILLEDINRSNDVPELKNKINNKEGLIRIGVASKALSRVFGKGKWTAAQRLRNRGMVVKELRNAISKDATLASNRWPDSKIKEIFGGINPSSVKGGE